MSVRLAMLARDEAPRMPAVADACKGLYDDWIVLLDHRTIDDTDASAYAHLEGPGRVIPFEFQNFAQARNLLFEVARPGAEWLLLADPDSPPSGTLPAKLEEADTWACPWHMGALEYHLPILVRASLECRYEGACHELLVGVGTQAVAREIRVDVPPKPVDHARLEGYLDLLIPDAQDNARSAFYLARTYDTLGRKGEAIEAYLYAAQMMQPPEQAFLCVQSAAILLVPIDVELARVLFERAHTMRPHRGETLYHLAMLANQTRDAGRAAGYCAEAVQLPACTDTLFVNRWAEHDGVMLELGRAINALRAAEGATTVED